MSLRIVFVPAAALACVLASACASEGPQPREEMSRARTLVDQADKTNAQRFATADLQRAHSQLSDAERYYGAAKYNEARAAAENAAVDADVATARASAAQAQQAAAEVSKGTSTLRDEAQRDASNAAAASAAATDARPPQ